MKYFVLFGVLTFLITACFKETLEIPDTGRRIVIDGLLTSDSLFNVRISKSAFITDISPSAFESMQYVNNAKIFVYQNKLLIDSLYNKILWHYSDEVYKISNYFSNSLIPIPGNEYEIIVKVPELPDAKATTKIPEIVRIESIDTTHIPLQNSSFLIPISIICNIGFTDPENEKNYYFFNIYATYSPYGIIHNAVFECKDPIVEEKLIYRYPLEGIAFTDKIINGKRYKLPIVINPNFIGYATIPDPNDPNKFLVHPDYKLTIYLRLYSITEEYFRYIQTLNFYNANYDNTFSDPILVPSNVTGGLGLLSGAAVASDSIVFRCSQ